MHTVWLGKETGVLPEDALIPLLLFLTALSALPAIVYHPPTCLPLCGFLSLVRSLLDSKRNHHEVPCGILCIHGNEYGEEKTEKRRKELEEMGGVLGEGSMSLIGSVHRTWPRHPRSEREEDPVVQRP